MWVTVAVKRVLMEGRVGGGMVTPEGLSCMMRWGELTDKEGGGAACEGDGEVVGSNDVMGTVGCEGHTEDEMFFL